MMSEPLYVNHSIIVNLDVDQSLTTRLAQVTKAGFSTIEINSCDPQLLKSLMQEFPATIIGAGNIVNTQQLEDCYHAGVNFVSSPGFLPAIAQTAAIYSIDYIPGVATLSEAMQALALGCTKVRPYPANLVFCASLCKAMPELKLYPAEVEWDEAEHYLSLPSVQAISILNPQQEQLKAFSGIAEAV
ncbi:MAG: multidrug DMT transporter permease [Legionellaceae bacterium]|nr:multidrug DMT transporter permease [Legionellaceae bacterium]